MKSDIFLIDNANILTQHRDRPTVSAVAWAHGRILALDDAARALPISHRWDAKQATLIPGFNDIHAHSVWFGQTLLEVNLGSARSAKDVYDALIVARQDQNDGAADADGENSSDKWLVASGFNPNLLAGDPITLDGLDDASGGRPLLIKHNSGHAMTVNSAALRRAGVDKNNPPTIEGGEVVVDGEGTATGLLDENAMRLIQDVVQPESQAEITAALEAAHGEYVREGLTSVTDCGVAGGWIGHSPREIAAYQAATLSARTQIMPTVDVLHSVPHHDADPGGITLDGGIRTGLGDDRLQIGPMKMFTDGSLLGTTAAMSENYQCCPHHGYFQGEPEELRVNALSAASAGWSLALHAIGDAAVEFAIDVIAEANAKYESPRVPHRIEHGGVVHDDQIVRMAKHGIVLVPQPRFIRDFGDAMADKIGAERTALSYPARRLLAAGMVLPGSSDRPVAEGAPLKVIESFVRRQTESGELYGGDDRISAEEAPICLHRGIRPRHGMGRHQGADRAGAVGGFRAVGGGPDSGGSRAHLRGTSAGDDHWWPEGPRLIATS